MNQRARRKSLQRGATGLGNVPEAKACGEKLKDLRMFSLKKKKKMMKGSEACVMAELRLVIKIIRP